MLYVTIKNKGGNTLRFFATSEDRAVAQALALGFIRKAENAKVTRVQGVCDLCFPHEGWAVLELSPRRGYKAITLGDQFGGQRQHSDELHPECHGVRYEQYKQIADPPAFTAEGFAS